MKKEIFKLLALLVFGAATLTSCSVESNRYNRHDRYHHDRDHNDHHYDRDHNYRNGY